MDVSISTVLGFGSLDERLSLIKNAGFRNITLWWTESEFERGSDQMKSVEKYGLTPENAHLPYKDCNDIWMPKWFEENYSSSTIEHIISCSECGIDTVVFHISTSKITPMYNEVGIERLKRIIDIAEKYNVDVAFENLRMPHYIDYIFENIKSERVKLCYDSGHNNCYYPADNILRKYPEKVAAVHLHDNCGKKDEHLLPFDGIAPWDDITDAIANSVYSKSLSLEIHKYEKYDSLTPEEYLSKAMQISQELLKMTLSKK